MSKIKGNPVVESSPLPEKIEKILDGFRESKATFVACDFGIFDKLHNSSSPQSAKEITEMLSSDLDATTRLLDTLVALEFLEKSKQGDQWLYKNTEIASKFLTTTSPDSQLGTISLFNKIVYPLHGSLESAVLDGNIQWMKAFGKSPEDIFRETVNSTEEDSLRFNKGMHSLAFPASYAVAKAVDLSAFNNCCDLGGGVGTLAYALCQYNPQMKITVCDLQPVVSLTHHFRPSVEDCPNQVNVSFMIGDFFQPETLPKADLYVLSRILHDWPEEKVEVILDNVFNCLPSGGGLLICEKILDEDKRGPKRALLESLTMLVATGGKERTASEYKHILDKHGFIVTQIKQLHQSLFMDAMLCIKK